MNPGRIATQMLVAGLVLVAALAWASPVMAQEAGSDDGQPIEAAISFDVGDYSAELHDWRVDAVLVSGNLEDGKDITLELLGTDGRVLWTATAPFTAPQARIEVRDTVVVGDVVGAGMSQEGTPVDPQLVPSEVVDPVQGGGGSSGQVATSMVLVIIVAVILFRTPLPAASTQRWTK